MFDTDRALEQALDEYPIWPGLYTAARLAVPRLNARPVDRGTGLHVEAHDPHPSSRPGLCADVAVHADSGHFIIEASTVPADRLYPALEAVGTIHPDTRRSGIPRWTWYPALPAPDSDHYAPGALGGSLTVNSCIAVHVRIEHCAIAANHHARSVLRVDPADRDACPAAWALGVRLFHLLASGTAATPPTTATGTDPSPDDGPEPDTDYTAATATAFQALNLLDGNPMFAAAREHDPHWPAAAEDAAARALRDLHYDLSLHASGTEPHSSGEDRR